MKIYRVELEDGGGPYYYRNGMPRDPKMPDFSNYKGPLILYGADSLESLKKLIENYGFNINDYIVKIYNSNKIHSYNRQNGHIIFEVEDESEVKE